MGLKEDILNANDRPVTPFPAPEWSKPTGLFLRTLTGIEKDKFDISRLPDQDKGPPKIQNISARFAILVLGDELGSRIFGDDDAPLLGAKSGAVLERIWQQGRRFNRMDADGVSEAKKDSAPIPGGASCTGSPSPAA
jgi:hypothetical protein